MPGADGPADGPPLAGAGSRRCAISRSRPRSRGRSRPRRRCARGATACARRPGARVPGAAGRAAATSAWPSTSARLARFEFSRQRRRAGRDRRRARRRRGGDARPTRSTSRPRSSRAAERARACCESEITRAEGKLANQGFVAKAPEAGRPGRARQARASCKKELEELS